MIEASRHAALAQLLRHIGDLERILSRIALHSARPRDLAQLRAALGALPRLDRSLRAVQAQSPSPLLQRLLEDFELITATSTPC